MTAMNLLLRITLLFVFCLPYLFLAMPHLPPVFALFLPVLAVVAALIADRISPPKRST
jgi:hypothetical protein